MSRTSIAVVLGVLVGAITSTQSFVNGRLGQTLGSVLLAGLVCGVVALAVLLVVGTVRGATGKIIIAWRHGHRPRLWHVAGIACSAVPLLVVAKAAPVMGVAWVTIALIGGQLLGSVLLDVTGLTPGGRRALTRTRTVGLLIATAAVAVLAVQGITTSVSLPLLALIVCAGIAVALTQVASGHVAGVWNSTGAAILTFTTITIVAGAAWLTLSDAPTSGLGQAPLWQLLGGGLLGASLVVMIATVIPKLGSLVTTLTQVAGQSIGAVAIDLLAPAGNPPTITTYLSLLLVCTAVAVVGRDQANHSQPQATSPTSQPSPTRSNPPGIG